MTQMRLTFLGTGTSQGVPMVGCDCPVCGSTDPRDHRTRSSVYIETPESAWVVDTGPDFRAQCLRERVRRVDAVVFTHSHTDHIMGFDDLRPFSVPGRPIPLYGSAGTLADVERAFRFAFNGENRFPSYIHPEPRPVTGPFQIGETELVPLPLPHGRTVVNGYLFRRGGRSVAAYLTDCKEVPAEHLPLLEGVPHLILDALRHRPHPTHMSVGEALAVEERVRPGRTWFTHICHELAHAETQAALPESVRMAYDGLQIDL